MIPNLDTILALGFSLFLRVECRRGFFADLFPRGH